MSKSILEGREELKAVVYQIAEVTGYLWQKGYKNLSPYYKRRQKNIKITTQRKRGKNLAFFYL